MSFSQILLATTYLIMSDRAQFWDAEKIGPQTEEIVKGAETKINFKAFKGQRVLFLVHGFNNTAKEALQTYRTIRSHIEDLHLYDAVIGYLWPGYDSRLEYFAAEKNAAELSSRVQTHIQNLSHFAAHVDIMAHSMGNRLVLEALQSVSPLQKKLVRNYYSLAPAVKNDDIEIKHPFYQSVQQCENLFIFHSNRDEVLKVAFLLAEQSEALSEDIPKKESKNVQFIDCSEFVDGHSSYFTAQPLYEFLKKQQAHQTPAAEKEANVKLLADGLVGTIRETQN